MKIAILEPLGVEKEKLLSMCCKAVGDRGEIIYYSTREENPEKLAERAKDADAVVFSNIPFPASVIAQCPNLKYVCVAFTGVDLVDVACCKEHGIQVSNCAGYSTVAVADLVFGMLLSLMRNIPACDNTVRQEGTKQGLVGEELEGKAFGIIGTGAIGLRVAKIAQAFGCRVYAWSRTVKPVEGITYVDLETLLSTCDIVSLHVPATPQTKHLINQERLLKMKKDAILINTARGPVVDSEALAQALKDGTIAKAAVDVFEMEPPIPKTHPLFGAPNLLATPHVAFATKQAMEKRAEIVCQNLKSWLDGDTQNLI